MHANTYFNQVTVRFNEDGSYINQDIKLGYHYIEVTQLRLVTLIEEGLKRKQLRTRITGTSESLSQIPLIDGKYIVGNIRVIESLQYFTEPLEDLKLHPVTKEVECVDSFPIYRKEMFVADIKIDDQYIPRDNIFYFSPISKIKRLKPYYQLEIDRMLKEIEDAKPPIFRKPVEVFEKCDYCLNDVHPFSIRKEVTGILFFKKEKNICLVCKAKKDNQREFGYRIG